MLSLSLASLLFLYPASFEQPEVPAPTEVVFAAARLGLDARTLACAGIHGSEVVDLLDEFVQRWESYAQLVVYEAGWADAQNDAFAANAALRLDAGDQQAALDLADALQRAGSARTSMESARTELIEDLVGSSTSSQAAQAVLLASPAACALPAAYRFAAAGDSEAACLGWALVMEAHAQDYDADIPVDARAELTAARSLAAVQVALQHESAQTQPNQLAIDQWMLTQ